MGYWTTCLTSFKKCDFWSDDGKHVCHAIKKIILFFKHLRQICPQLRKEHVLSGITNKEYMMNHT